MPATRKTSWAISRLLRSARCSSSANGQEQRQQYPVGCLCRPHLREEPQDTGHAGLGRPSFGGRLTAGVARCRRVRLSGYRLWRSASVSYSHVCLRIAPRTAVVSCASLECIAVHACFKHAGMWFVFHAALRSTAAPRPRAVPAPASTPAQVALGCSCCQNVAMRQQQASNPLYLLK